MPLQICLEKLDRIQYGQIEGHCGARGPFFLTKQEGLNLVSLGREVGLWRRWGKWRLERQINSSSLPENFEILAHELKNVEFLEPPTVLQVVSRMKVGQKHFQVWYRGNLIQEAPITSASHAVMMFYKWTERGIITPLEATWLLQQMILQGFNETISETLIGSLLKVLLTEVS